MNRLRMITMCLLAMMAASLSVKAQEVTITLMPGWTWISVPITEVQDFATTLGSFTPMNGDIIKSQWGNASYANGQWRGNISQFYPGYGYMYKSTRTMPVTVTFNVQQPAPQVIVTTAEPTDITTNSATCGGNVASSDGNYVFVILRGICWSTNPNPTFNDNYVEVGNGIGSFTASMTDLAIGTTYYVRAFAVTANGTFYGDELSFTTLPEGAIDGLFTINANGDQVRFSQGNLQYQASTNTWRFAENQWDYIGDANSNISATYDGWIDLFGWGTSGYHDTDDPYNVNYQPWSSANSELENDYNTYGYGPSTNMTDIDLTGTSANYDWGVYNPISNGGNVANQWRALTRLEWNYLLNTRNTTSGIRFAKAQVSDVNGVILLPDNWISDTYNLNNTNSIGAYYNSNVISAAQWDTIESAGGVFLPAAGGRFGTSVADVGSVGFYWLASCNSSSCCATYVYVYYAGIYNVNYRRYLGRSVRLVCPAEN